MDDRSARPTISRFDLDVGDAGPYDTIDAAGAVWVARESGTIARVDP